jgi:biopolymer transport protein ExbD
MAFSSGGSQSGGGGFGRRRFGGSTGTLSDINIIPLVDVVLVLLIIFMLTAHVMDFGLEINVPEVTQTRDTAEELPVVGITRDARLFLNEKSVSLADLPAQIAKRFKSQKAVYVMADRNGKVDPLMQVVDVLSKAGLQIKVVTKPYENASGRR